MGIVSHHRRSARRIEYKVRGYLNSNEEHQQLARIAQN